MDIIDGIFGNVKKTKTNDNNVYDSNNYRKNQEFDNQKRVRNSMKSQQPLHTKVIPKDYNKLQTITDRQAADDDSVFSDVASQCSGGSIQSRDKSLNLNDHMAFFNKQNMISDNRRHEQNFLREHDNLAAEAGFVSQFEEPSFNNPNGPVSANNTPKVLGQNGNMRKLEMERELALKGEYSNFDNNIDMTYGVVDDQDFVHNNMVPFFKNGVGKGYGPDSIMQQKWNDIKQRKVDTFTGSIKNPEYRPKTERRPLFNPQVGITWVYGMPDFTSFYEDRYIPSRERRNELLMQPTRVTPGLDLNYGAVSKQGFHEMYRGLPKTVDELRAANNPKVTYGKPVQHGKLYDKRAVIPNVANRKAPTFHENDARDMVKSLGYWRAPAMYGNFDVPSTNRQQTTQAWYGGVAFQNDAPRPESMLEMSRLPNRENFLSPTPRNVTGVDHTKNTSHTANSYYLQPTNRQTTAQKTWINPAGPGYQKGYAMDHTSWAPDATRRDQTQNVTQLNPAGPEWQKNYTIDRVNWSPDATIRDQTQNVTQLNPACPSWSKHQAVDHVQWTPDATIRDQTQNVAQLNPAGPAWQKHRATDYALWTPDATRRDQTQNVAQLNPAGPVWQKHRATDYALWTPDATRRDQTQNVTQLNPAGPEWQKAYTINREGWTPNSTIRDQTQNVTQLNPTCPSWSKHRAVDHALWTPDATRRDQTQNVAQLNPAGPEWQKSYTIDREGWAPDSTIRDQTQNVTQLRPACPSWNKGYVYDGKNWVPDATRRDQTQETTHLAPAGYGQERAKGGYMTAQEGTVAPTTLRQGTQNAAYLAPVGYGQERGRGGYQTAHEGTVAPTTLRQDTQNVAYLAPAGYGQERERGGYQTTQEGTVAPTTLRQGTQNTAYLAPVGYGQERERGGYQAAQAGTVAPTTRRQITQNNTYQGPVILHDGLKYRVREDAVNSLVNVSKDEVTKVRDGGRPTTSNYEKSPTFETLNVELCEPIQINRDVYGFMGEGQRPLQCMPTMHTHIANQFPQWTDERRDSCVTTQLASNPYINNTQHRNVEYQV